MKAHRALTTVALACLVLATLFGNGVSVRPAQAAADAAPPATAPADAGCGMNFSDVPVGSWFYPYVEYLYCTHAVSGYGSEFRPGAQTTRAQLTKMISLALGWPASYSGPAHFADVPATF